MITGSVTLAREAVLPMVLIGVDGLNFEIEGIVDTGFDGFLTLPSSVIRRLSIPLLGRVRASLGDGSEVGMPAYEASVLWDRRERSILVLEAEGVPLVGMAMLLGYRLTIDVEEDGLVRVESLPSNRKSAH